MKFGEMEFGEMKRNTSNWSKFLHAFYIARVWQRQLGFLVLAYPVYNHLTTILTYSVTYMSNNNLQYLTIRCVVNAIDDTLIILHSSYSHIVW